MLTTDKPIVLNVNDTVAFTSNLTVLANAAYANNEWTVSATVVASGSIEGHSVEATRKYDIPAALLTEMDNGDGLFAKRLGLIVESFVAEELRLCNPGVEILVVL